MLSFASCLSLRGFSFILMIHLPLILFIFNQSFSLMLVLIVIHWKFIVFTLVRNKFIVIHMILQWRTSYCRHTVICEKRLDHPFGRKRMIILWSWRASYKNLFFTFNTTTTQYFWVWTFHSLRGLEDFYNIIKCLRFWHFCTMVTFFIFYFLIIRSFDSWGIS